MKRNLYPAILILFSVVLLSVCFHTRLKAADDLVPSSDLDPSLQDPCRHEIFESRQFSGLVVSIQAEEEDLYSEETGILKGQQVPQGREGECPVRLFVYRQDGTPLIAQKAGIRISGASSRSAVRRSFRLIARSDYDEEHSCFTCDLWNGRQVLDGTGLPIHEYRSFILHSVRYAMDSTGIHNSVGYALARKAGMEDASPTTPAAVYVNGIYQGAYFILPAKNDHALAELYHIENPKDIEFVSVFEEEKTGIQTSPVVLEEYLSFVDYLHTCDMNDPAVIARIERQLDVEQCLEYYAVNLLLGNGDWLDNNLRVWRCKNNGLPYQDGKWRYFLFDLDWIGSFPDLVADNFRQATQSEDNYNILPCLLRNPEYTQLFKEIIARMERDAFHMEMIESVFAQEEARMLDEITYDFQSDAFPGYLMYSINSSMPEAEDYLTLEDRQNMIEDFKSHLLSAPEVIHACLEVYFP